jgi:hypothetical protein
MPSRQHIYLFSFPNNKQFILIYKTHAHKTNNNKIKAGAPQQFNTNKLPLILKLKNYNTRKLHY